MLAVETLEVETESAEETLDEMTTYNHSYICLEILTQLIPNQAIKPLPELTLDVGKGIKPDISVFSKDQAPPPNYLKDITRYNKMPLLAIEVISPSQDVQDLLDKADMLVKEGVKTVWTIEPFGRTIFITTKDGTEIVHNTMVESDGVSIDFAKIFDYKN